MKFNMTLVKIITIIATLAVGSIGYSVSLVSGIFKLGTMSYTITGDFEIESESSPMTNTYELAYFPRMNYAILVGHQLAYDTELKRNRYSATYIGGRYYYLTTGRAVSASTDDARVFYRFSYKPYVEGGASTGKLLIRSVGNLTYDATSDFFGVYFAKGLMYAFSDVLDLDTFFKYEVISGSGHLELSATALILGLGVSYHL